MQFSPMQFNPCSPDTCLPPSDTSLPKSVAPHHSGGFHITDGNWQYKCKVEAQVAHYMQLVVITDTVLVGVQGAADRHLRPWGLPLYLCIWSHSIQCPLSLQTIPGRTA